VSPRCVGFFLVSFFSSAGHDEVVPSVAHLFGFTVQLFEVTVLPCQCIRQLARRLLSSVSLCTVEVADRETTPWPVAGRYTFVLTE